MKSNKLHLAVSALSIASTLGPCAEALGAAQPLADAAKGAAYIPGTVRLLCHCPSSMGWQCEAPCTFEQHVLQRRLYRHASYTPAKPGQDTTLFMDFIDFIH